MSDSTTTPAQATPSTAPTKKPWPWWARWARELVVVVVLAFGLRELLAIARAPSIAVGVPPPKSVGRTLDGRPFDLAAVVAGAHGAPVFINLWATWCPPCRAELPDLAKAAAAHSDVVFVGLASPSSDLVEARALLKTAGVGYLTAIIDAQSEARWNLSAVPSSVLLDGKGNVVWRRAGTVDEGDIDDALRDLQR